ncbi:toxin-activating lysine-acyltransferase [Sphingomonas sp. PAMC 26605]|uniref:toxin-activating lysine-acyltransferase n=1 Tax=Sphingomonas sp. PAMC 26605 TaxID=1112214 RepID=UPI0012F4E18E|nr:hypothetical protein [Sphingomonas sp. PAMC 26605]
MKTDIDIETLTEFLLDYNKYEWPDWLIQYHLEVPISRQQVALQFDDSSQVAGIMVWAFVGDDIHCDLLRGKARILHLSEWNEGLNLWAWAFMSQQRTLPLSFRNQLRELARLSGVCHLGVYGSPKICAIF